MGHTYSHVLLQVIFGVKDRQSGFCEKMRSKLLRHLRGIADNLSVVTVAHNAVDDHVHSLLGVKPSLAPSDVVNKLKANSSRWMHQSFPSMRSFAWQTGSSAFSVSPSAVPKVTEYIKTQASHHRRISYREEVEAFLKRHGVEFDPKNFGR